MHRAVAAVAPWRLSRGLSLSLSSLSLTHTHISLSLSRGPARLRAAGFLQWERVQAEAGRMREDTRFQRYTYGHSGGGDGTGGRRRWFVLVQMFYNAGEVAKLLNASDVVLVNYGLHYCQPARKLTLTLTLTLTLP